MQEKGPILKSPYLEINPKVFDKIFHHDNLHTKCIIIDDHGSINMIKLIRYRMMIIIIIIGSLKLQFVNFYKQVLVKVVEM